MLKKINNLDLRLKIIVGACLILTSVFFVFITKPFSFQPNTNTTITTSSLIFSQQVINSSISSTIPSLISQLESGQTLKIKNIPTAQISTLISQINLTEQSSKLVEENSETKPIVTELVPIPKFTIQKKTEICSYLPASQMLELLNEHRNINSKMPLSLALDLNQVACVHSKWMTEMRIFSHTGIDSTSPFQRCSNAGTFCLAENIANNPSPSVAGFMEQFKNSPGHNNNMLSGDYTEVGFGFDGAYITQIFR
jgi:uncharacterized protein YkwD